MRPLRQMAVVGFLSLRSLHTRIKGSLVIVAGLACVVGVLLSILSIGEGLRLAYLRSGRSDRAVVLSAGADRDLHSSIPEAWVNVVRNAPGIRRGADGAPLLDAEVYIGVSTLIKRANQKSGYTGVRGIGAKGLEMSPEIKIVDGRYYRPGTRELIVGVMAQRKFSSLELGDRVALSDGGEWIVVGHFSTGSFTDGDVIADPQVMLAALRRSNYNVVLVSLESPAKFDELNKALTTNPELSVTVERESDYWQRRFSSLPVTAVVTAYFLSLLIASGAISGILHTMHATVSSRATEIAILRAVGFGGLPVAVSIVLEAMFFACIGAAIGTGIDWLWESGYAYNGAYGVFRVTFTLHLFAVAIGWALVTALVGAIVPAMQEARLPVVDALGRL
jgi:putative ABC transport system permease protein